MASIATAIIAYPDLTLWLGIGLWGLFVLCAGGILLTALSGYTTATPSRAATMSSTPVYQQAA